MLYSEKEANLIDFFRQMEKEEICLIPSDYDTESIARVIREPVLWAKWKDSSKKSEIPPDFYSDELSLMMEVMRIDDHGYEVDGNIVNPTYEREHEIERKLKSEGILELFPNLESIIINAKTDLPTDEDHNYRYYLENYKRTMLKHIRHIPNYKKNHPGYKVIFFIFDESGVYFLRGEEPMIDAAQRRIYGCPHWFFADEAFVDVFRNTEIDYIIWCAPFKYINTVGINPVQVRGVVIDVKRYDVSTIEYDTSRMMSTEV